MNTQDRNLQLFNAMIEESYCKLITQFFSSETEIAAYHIVTKAALEDYVDKIYVNKTFRVRLGTDRKTLAEIQAEMDADSDYDHYSQTEKRALSIFMHKKNTERCEKEIKEDFDHTLKRMKYLEYEGHIYAISEIKLNRNTGIELASIAITLSIEKGAKGTYAVNTVIDMPHIRNSEFPERRLIESFEYIHAELMSVLDRVKGLHNLPDISIFEKESKNEIFKNNI